MSKEVYMLCDVNGNQEKRPFPQGGGSEGSGVLIVTLTEDDSENYVANHTLKEIYDNYQSNIPVFIKYSSKIEELRGSQFQVPVLTIVETEENRFSLVGGCIYEDKSVRIYIAVDALSDGDREDWIIFDELTDDGYDSDSNTVITIEVTRDGSNFSGSTTSDFKEVIGLISKGSLVTFKMVHPDGVQDHNYFIRSYCYNSPDDYHSKGTVHFKYEGSFTELGDKTFLVDWSGEGSLSIYLQDNP